MGIAQPDAATMRTFLGPPLADTFGQHFGMDEEQIDYAIEKYRERYHDVGLFENSVFVGVPEMLDALAARGFALAVATSKPTYSATRILEHFGLAERFVFIGGAALDGTRQDKADVIAHSIEELGARGVNVSAQRARMVGDRRHDVLGAREHGLDCIGVLWGYGDEEELLGAGAVALVPEPLGLLELAELGNL